MTSDVHVRELFNLSGRTVLVTGASGHLGSVLASALAEAGATVVVASRDAERGEVARKNLPDSDRHHAVILDQLDESSLQRGFDEALRKAGQIDILINNGHEATDADLFSVTAEQFSRQLANATGYFLLARLLRDHAVSRQEGASIVMLGSMYGLVGSYPDAYADIGPASPVAYHVLKGGIVQLTRHLAVYWAHDNVRVNCLSPGPFPGPQAPPELVRRLETKSPLGRMGTPTELKGPLLLLASDAGSYITGQNIVVDGGWTAW
ncbi:MAG: SDR family oxidoreductase [Aeoliella sp.]